MSTSIATIEEFLSHKRLALVGASHDPKDFSRAVMRELTARGYDVVPVNRRPGVIGDRPSYAHVVDIPVAVDGAIVMVPGREARAVVEDCIRAGVPRVWLHRGAGHGSSTPEALAAARDEGLVVVDGECPLMFACGSGVHAFHGAVRRLSGHFPVGGVAAPTTWLVVALALIQAVVGANALASGALLVLDPTGANLGLDPAALAPSPFATFLVPGLVLLLVLGAGHLAAGLATIRRAPRAPLFAVGLGAFLVLWIVVQLAWLEPRSWLQPVLAALGLAEIGLGLHGARRAARPCPRPRQEAP